MGTVQRQFYVNEIWCACIRSSERTHDCRRFFVYACFLAGFWVDLSCINFHLIPFKHASWLFLPPLLLRTFFPFLWGEKHLRNLKINGSPPRSPPPSPSFLPSAVTTTTWGEAAAAAAAATSAAWFVIVFVVPEFQKKKFWYSSTPRGRKAWESRVGSIGFWRIKKKSRETEVQKKYREREKKTQEIGKEEPFDQSNLDERGRMKRRAVKKTFDWRRWKLYSVHISIFFFLESFDQWTQ